MERRLKVALLNTINDYNAIVKQIADPCISPEQGLQLSAARDALFQVIQHFAKAEYLECVGGQWRIKVIVIMEQSDTGQA